jgi:hypothetical protein
MADAKVDMALGKIYPFIYTIQFEYSFFLDDIIKKNRRGPGNRRGGRGGNTIQRRGGNNQRGNRGGRIGKGNNNNFRNGGNFRRGGGGGGGGNRISFGQRNNYNNNNRGNKYEIVKKNIFETNRPCLFLVSANDEEAEEIQFQVLIVEM